MNIIKEKLIKEFKKENNANGSEEIISTIYDYMKEYFFTVVNSLIQSEFSEKIKVKKYERKIERDNYRNGSYTRRITTMFGDGLIIIPRDRKGIIKSTVIERYSRRTFDINNLIFAMLKENLTYEEIIEILDKIYNKSLSKQTLSTIFNNLKNDVEKFKTRRLKKEYFAVYIDSTYIPLKRNSVEREAINVLIGVTKDGFKEVLSYRISPSESKYILKDMFSDIKSQGVEKVDVFIFDGLPGVDEVIAEAFPESKMQRCIIHISRNLMKYVRKNEREEIANDFKLVYSQTTKIDALKQQDVFINKWTNKGYGSTVKRILSNPYLYTYYDFDLSKQKSIYTNNAIESLNSELKAEFRKKRLFQNEMSLEISLVSFFNNWNYKRSFKRIPGFSSSS